MARFSRAHGATTAVLLLLLVALTFDGCTAVDPENEPILHNPPRYIKANPLDGRDKGNCLLCPIGYTASRCQGDVMCEICHLNNSLYLPGPKKNTHRCLRCREPCFSSEIEIRPCTHTRDRICKYCGSGPCRENQIEVQKCTHDQNRVCKCIEEGYSVVNTRCVRDLKCNLYGPNIESDDQKICAELLTGALINANMSAKLFSLLERVVARARKTHTPGPERMAALIHMLSINDDPDSSFRQLYRMVQHNEQLRHLRTELCKIADCTAESVNDAGEIDEFLQYSASNETYVLGAVRP